MKNLKDVGLVLRTLKINNISQLVEDLNANFSLIMHLPAYKGIKGDDGVGTPGASGVRGATWKIIDVTLQPIIQNKYNLTSPSQIDLNFLNNLLTSNFADFLSDFGLTELVNGDLFVTPSLAVLSYDEATTQFVSSGITFSNGAGLDADDVLTIVNNVLSQATNNPIDKVYNTLAKLYADSSSGLNTSFNPLSALDIDVVGSGVGVAQPNYKLIAPNEGQITDLDQISFIRGSAKDYHNLVQDTLTNDTHDYAPGIDNTPILVLLQNDYESGIFMGDKKGSSMRFFARIYKPSQTSLRLTPTNEKNQEDAAFLDLGLDATVFGNGEVLLRTYNSDGVIRLQAKTVEHKNMSLDDVTNFGGTTGTELRVTFDDVYFNGNISQGAVFLGLDGTGRLTDNGYLVSTALTDNDNTKLVTSDLIFSLNSSLQSQIDSMDSAIQTLRESPVFESNDVSNKNGTAISVPNTTGRLNIHSQTAHQNLNEIDLNNLTKMGNYIFSNADTLINSPLPYNGIDTDSFTNGNSGVITYAELRVYSHLGDYTSLTIDATNAFSTSDDMFPQLVQEFNLYITDTISDVTVLRFSRIGLALTSTAGTNTFFSDWNRDLEQREINNSVTIFRDDVNNSMDIELLNQVPSIQGVSGNVSGADSGLIQSLDYNANSLNTSNGYNYSFFPVSIQSIRLDNYGRVHGIDSSPMVYESDTLLPSTPIATTTQSFTDSSGGILRFKVLNALGKMRFTNTNRVELLFNFETEFSYSNVTATPSQFTFHTEIEVFDLSLYDKPSQFKNINKKFVSDAFFHGTTTLISERHIKTHNSVSNNQVFHPYTLFLKILDNGKVLLGITYSGGQENAFNFTSTKSFEVRDIALNPKDKLNVTYFN